MQRQIIILLAAVTLTVAMVPKLRRAVNLEEEMMKSATTSPTSEVCKPETPCAWFIYVSSQKIIDTNFINTYCKCAAGTECQYTEDDENLNAFIHRCRPPSYADDKES